MACCLTAPSHYLNQCWLSLVRLCGIHLRAIQQRAPKYLFHIISLKIRLSKLLPLFPGANELKTHPDSSGVANDCVFTGDICGTGGRRVQSCQLQRIGYCCEKMDPTLTGRTTGYRPLDMSKHCTLNRILWDTFDTLDSQDSGLWYLYGATPSATIVMTYSTSHDDHLIFVISGTTVLILKLDPSYYCFQTQVP